MEAIVIAVKLGLNNLLKMAVTDRDFAFCRMNNPYCGKITTNWG